MKASKDITFVLTSCGRFDLLAETMRTFVAHNTAPIARYVVIEDSGDATVRDVVAGLGFDVDVIVNDPPCGQVASIDRAYAGVATPYIFHCEDDWRFFRSGFVEDSLVVLENVPTASMVSCRRSGQVPYRDAVVAQTLPSTVRGVPYRLIPPHAHDVWYGYEFGPGLRRLADYRRIGSFASHGHEQQASRWFKRQGMGVAVLEHPAYETTGRGRHLRDPTAPTRTNLRGLSAPPGDVPAPASRNAPCPCGSGVRYKDCHGVTH
jgi:SEC-C motif